MHSLFNRGMVALIECQGEGANFLMIEFDHKFQAIRVWGAYDKKWDRDPIEKLHTQFYKY